MTDTTTTEQPPSAVRRDRSPNFPAIGLGRAVERARQLYNRARRYEARLADAATAWGIRASSSGTLQTAAALIAFGLAEDSGSGNARKIKISDLGWRILEDHRPSARETALAEAALKPKLIADYLERWRAGRPDDNFCISELKIERGFTEDAAARFLKVFDETIQFTNPSSPDTVSDRKTDGEGDALQQRVEPPVDALSPPSKVKVGDYVQWVSDGQEQFPKPRRVNAISEDGSFAQVFGSMTGIPTSELAVVDPPKPARQGQNRRSASSAYAGGDGELNVLLRGNRLEISADVDRAGLLRLKEILSKYEEILALLEPAETEEEPC
jgi:hypothetical protein